MARFLAVVFLSIFVASLRPGSLAAAEPPDWAGVSTIFAERCVMCHSAQGASLGLRLDTYEATLAGSSKGAVLLPGDPAGSELLRRLRGESLPRMPFLSYPLPPREIDLIERWVEAGLPETSDGAALPETAGGATPHRRRASTAPKPAWEP